MGTLSAASRQAGKRVRGLREGREWTLETLAEKVGLTRKGLSKIELGRVASSIDVYAALARALGVQLADLLTPPKRKARRVSRKATGHEKTVRASEASVVAQDRSCTPDQ